MTWRNIVLGQRDNPLGMGSTVPLGTVPLVIPFPQKGNGILLLCGFIFAIIIIIDVVVVVKVFVLNNGDISLIFQDISMKLGGHIGHGANSSYHHL